MLAIASQIILCLVLAALLGLIIGYLLGRSNCPKDTYRAGAIHDPNTADDGDCNDTEEVSEVNTVSVADVSEDSETETNTEVQGLMQADDVTTEESVAAENASAATEAAAVEDNSDEASDEEGEPETPSDDDKPATLLDAPRNGKKDNLTRIKGIGVKIDALLNSVGVYHFDQIAAWTEKEANWIDHQLAFPGRSKRDDWVGQAKLLAEGKETEFSKRVDAGEVASSKKG